MVSRKVGHYNSLLCVAEADRALNALGGENIVSQILSVFVSAGLEREFGIRLLHKHNDIVSGEVMLERSVVDDAGFALVTRPALSTETGQMLCNSWQLTETGFTPCEYSSTDIVFNPKLDLAETAPVFSLLATALRDFGVESILGPCRNYSECVDAHRPSVESKLLETTDEENRANVVRFVTPDDVGLVQSVKTKWHAEQVEGEVGKLMWAAGCKLVCSIIPETGKHQGTKTHVRTRSI